jgi:phage pi2 protein 07
MYDAHSLFAYIQTSGDFYDPISRIQYDRCELIRLEHLVNVPRYTLIINKEKLIEMRENRISAVGLCDAFENELMDQITLIENEFFLPDFEKKLQIEIFPLILQCFENYKNVDIERCLMTLSNILRYLKNKPLHYPQLQFKLYNAFEMFLNTCQSSEKHFEQTII